MVKSLVVRGLLVGLLAGLVAGVFAFFVGEPRVDAAIALEEAAAAVSVDGGDTPSSHYSDGAAQPSAPADSAAQPSAPANAAQPSASTDGAAQPSAPGDAARPSAPAGGGEEAHSHDDGASAGHSHGEEAVVSRPVQKVGLFLATGLYGLAVGGIFALVFAALRGRVGPRSEPGLAIVTAACAFGAITLVPFLKYPANPPAVGDPETINARTLLYVVTVLVGLASIAIAVAATRRVTVPGVWAKGLVGGVTFLIPVIAAWVLLPRVDEVPPGFPASLLWDFRLASLGTQVVFWVAFGVLFAVAGERAKARVS
ncbi:CbtA family protein [Nonomuraea sp. NPDC003754]